ncbi:MAG TPA: LuxR C-terminal-related transcriptional regulator [Thermoleophilaceae bacterium]|nr:LuxR C-terminal-related transcriptional regulator [Thermoleophilaceae bacterium]
MTIDELERGREACARLAWADAHESLSRADRASPLEAADLRMLATAAYMLGRDDDYLAAMERAHHLYLEAGEPLPAVRCAFWIGLNRMVRGEMSRATGWFARAQRLLDREQRDCVERGYLLIPVLLQALGAGKLDAASATAAHATEIAVRFGDSDLLALAGHEHGHALIRQGRPEEGLRLLDEAMVAATAGELSPIVTGLVYCSVIAHCHDLYELRRAREWTEALTHWCEQQPDMVAHTGVCLVHRAEIFGLQGAWANALEEARRARERCAQGMVNRRALGEAVYLQAEVHRLLGEFDAAEDAYREASRYGREPQPGLALLRLAQGRNDTAAAAIRRAVAGTSDRFERARLLPGYVEVMLAVGATEEASSASRELEEISSAQGSVLLGAMSAGARGAVALARGDAGDALGRLRHARQLWDELDVPYEAARMRVLVGLACRALGDEDTAALELEAARGAFTRLRAAPDLARIDSLSAGADSVDDHGLTPRELEVLRFVAAGKTNRAIAADLVLSERTVDRHVSNILTKLGVSSRAAATAYAYQHELV